MTDFPGSQTKPVPLYRQVRDAIVDDIRERRLAPHDQYYSESAAMEKYGVSRVTIRQAYRLLEQDSMLYRAHGKGTYVAPPPVQSVKTVAFLATCVLQSGVETVMLRSIEEFFDHHDINLIICIHEDSFTKAERYVKRLIQWGADGLIYMGVRSSSAYEKNGELLQAVINAGIPCIQIDRYVDSLAKRIISVRPDNFGGSKAVTAHLLSLGHKRIGFCGSTMSSAVRDRKEGCRAALKEAGLDLRPDMQWDFLSEKDYRSVALQISAMNNRPSAIVVVSDDAAFHLIDAVRERGMVVPDDIAIVGFDDYSAYGQPSKGLTTVRVGHWEEGRIAATLLAEMISGVEVDPKPYLIPAELVVRESCGSRLPERQKNHEQKRRSLLERTT